MKRLIINADDLGADHTRNAGIFTAMEVGAVTAASILVNGPAFPEVLERISTGGFDAVSFGIHLNLSEGRPLTPGPPSLTGPDGCFLGKAEAHRRLMTKGDSALERDIRREFSAQIGALCDAGVRVDHLDGHQHIHVFPAVIDAAISAGREFGIPWIRVPEEPPPPGFMDRNGSALRVEAEMFCRFAAAARERIHRSALFVTDHFRGLYLKGRLTPEELEKTLQALPPGLTELMVHPGRESSGRGKGPFSSFSNRDRQEELETLTDGKFPVTLTECGLRLTPFPEEEP